MDSVTLSGREFTSDEIGLIQEIVETCGKISRRELALTICENISWLRPNGAHKVDACYVALEKLQRQGIISLPEKKIHTRKREVVTWTDRSAPPTDEIVCELSAVSPILIEVAVGRDQQSFWNELIDRYHYLRYQKPFGSHLRYFVIATQPTRRIVGCLLFSASAWAVAARDKQIGWTKEHREKFLHLVVNNSRFLILPWVKIPNLASHVLGLAAAQIEEDWYKWFAYRPILLETFVDKARYTGGCYKAANWQFLGHTVGRQRTDRLRRSDKGEKMMFIYPLKRDFRDILTGKVAVPRKRRAKKPPTLVRNRVSKAPDEKFLNLWKKVFQIMTQVAAEYDAKWRQRARTINSLMVIILIFRLVSSAKRGYGSVIGELWENCADVGFCLPQQIPIAASSFGDARIKLGADVFKVINTRVIEEYEHVDGFHHQWRDRRIFAVNGTKVTLPRSLFAAGFESWSTNHHYPHGLLSSIYNVKSQIPYDFSLSRKADERLSAIGHLSILSPGDTVVYDRGYFSHELLQHHLQLGIDVVFRVAKGQISAFDQFMASDETDKLIEIEPSSQSLKEMKKTFSSVVPACLRLVKSSLYDTACHETVICTLATTLLTDNFTIEDFRELYHLRWKSEELYKLSQETFCVGHFHAQTLIGVTQEIFAHFALITMNRLFSNPLNQQLNQPPASKESNPGELSAKWQINFRNCIATVNRNLERLFFGADFVRSTVEKILNNVSRLYSKYRPDRHFPRVSMQPVKKWALKKGCEVMVAAADGL